MFFFLSITTNSFCISGVILLCFYSIFLGPEPFSTTGRHLLYPGTILDRVYYTNIVDPVLNASLLPSPQKSTKAIYCYH